ncbi:MAG: DUF1553 domain-containing protein, partial [Planctomycetota bacterium]
SNRLLSYVPRVRLEAEVLRDTVLATAGLLSKKMFGPPVRPPQPRGVTEAAYGSPKWKASRGEDRFRRSVYTYLKRTAPFAMFSAFDGPSGESCVARREVSNSPLQALTLLNDVMLVEAAQAFGGLIASSSKDDTERVRYAVERALCREATDHEVDLLLSFTRAQRDRFRTNDAKDVAKFAGGDAGDAVERAAWTALARALLCLDEFVTRP